MSREEGRTLKHELWGGSSGICEAHCTSVRVHAERSLHKVVLMDVFELRKEAMRQLSNEFCHQKITAEPTSPYKKGTDLLIIMEKTNRWF